MIPILYDKTETSFTSNGLGRLRDCISATVTEERNGLYELDFQYPVTGANYDLIQLGRIVGVTHDDTGDVQPFDIVSFSKPIDGVVTFHCVHISYRQSYMTVTLSNISHISTALMRLNSAEPSNPFSYWTDKSSTGYLASADGTPRSVRQMLGGIEGSILDTYGGEYEWDKFLVKLWNQRGQERDFAIRYGVNMLTYDDDTDSQGTYSSCVPYWSDSTETVVGNRVDSFGSTVTGRGECVPLDLSDKFENKPTTSQLETMAASIMNSENTFLPTQTIKVSFVRLQDMSEYQNYSSLLQCGLCDTVKVVFPDYGTQGSFKIVKTVWDVLMDRYESMELGTLSTTLSEALGITNSLEGGGSSVLDFYPVGSYYETSDAAFDPNVTWGGTWSLETAGQVHVSAGTGYTIGATGGEATHKLTINEMPQHRHGLYPFSNGAAPNGSYNGVWLTGALTQYTAYEGQSQAHNNMQPYIVVNRWHRTA